MPTFLLLLLTLSIPMSGPVDTLVVRTVPAATLDGYRADPDYRYDRAPVAEETLWDRIKAWIWREVFEPLFAPALAPVRRVVFYGLVVLGVLFALINLLRMDRHGLFSKRKGPASLAFADLEQDPARLDLDGMLATALASEAYRRAVRLTYLKALRDLSEQGFLRWRKDKTNHAYLAELAPRPLRASFSELTYLFEYAWYGGFAVDAATFARVRAAYERLMFQMGDG